MSNFVAFLPAPASSPAPATELEAIARIWQDVSQIPQPRIEQRDGFGFVTGTWREADPIQTCFNEDGCVLVKGLIVDVRSDDPTVAPAQLLREFVETGRLNRDRYEGAFSAVLWDARRRRGLLVNDLAAMLNTFYGEFPQGLYVGTRALPIARALRLPLAPEAVCDFFARGQLMAPDTMFRGLKRLNVGEQLFYEDGRAVVDQYWLPYSSAKYTTVPQAAAAIGEVLVDRARRLTHGRQPVVCDLTSGFDSRLSVCCCDRAGADYAVTVNGDPDSVEVLISKLVAETNHRKWLGFFPRDMWTTPVDALMRRDLVYRTDAVLPFANVYHQAVTRPDMSHTYAMHLFGGYGDFIRYHPWSHEFWNIGKRRLADIPKLIRYRFVQGGLPPQSLFERQWLPSFLNRLRTRIEAVCRLGPDTFNTQQLDAVHAWKMTGHFSGYISAAWDWMPSTSPLGVAGLFNAAVATSWKAKSTTRLIRQVMYDLAPNIARIKTQYGGTAMPPTWKTLHREAFHCARQLTHLADKVDRMAFHGVLGAMFRKKDVRAPFRVPYLTPEFRAEMTFDNLRSRRLYQEDALKTLLKASDDQWYANDGLMLKIATLELICREIDFEPDRDFLPNQAAIS
ncbi:MAG: hypothetical protein LLG00_07950 [Planctomycetaceae bacterium]|nr:hypothetical protein [Planctomycetaceae bacterium]